ncbi:hypothetical protein BJ742DRAFT_773045 [Cladochytrium replicatum]|nr:hypothetical protein BJ742DRAFT_773045 [Cladochytrium replicatum]
MNSAAGSPRPYYQFGGHEDLEKTGNRRKTHDSISEDDGPGVQRPIHVRMSNQASFALYTDTLKYDVHEIEQKCYVDGEDAYICNAQEFEGSELERRVT